MVLFTRSGDRTSRRAFTLVELLVVIAIIGVLVALLLPAVQQAREAGRRSQCLNNFKQLGIGIHNHHDQMRKLPPGSAWDQQVDGFGTATTYDSAGSSWLVYLLPFVEQRTVYEKLLFSKGTAAADLLRSGSGVYANNITVMSRLSVPAYQCPSSPLPKFASNNIMAGTYAGIAGAGWATSPIAGYADTRFIGGSGAAKSASNGTFFPNSVLGFQDLQDGLSNVMIVGEEGDWMFENVSGTATKRDWRAQVNGRGFNVGSLSAAVPTSGGTITVTNAMLTVADIAGTQSAINLKKGTGGLGWASGNGVGADGQNTPLRSAHPGGICILIGDASARFITQTVNLDTLTRMAIRDDGNPVELP